MLNRTFIGPSNLNWFLLGTLKHYYQSFLKCRNELTEDCIRNCPMVNLISERFRLRQGIRALVEASTPGQDPVSHAAFRIHYVQGAEDGVLSAAQISSFTCILSGLFCLP